jgi:hypothetical protein
MRPMMSALAVFGWAVAMADAKPPAAWVTVTGQVVLPPDVAVPPPMVLQGPPGGVPDESVLVNPKTRGVKNVVVWLRPDNKDLKSKLSPEEIHPADAKRATQLPLVAFSPRLVFEPRILTARVGDTVVVQNQSPQVTNFFWDSANNGGVNAVLAPGQVFKMAAPLVAEPSPIAFKSNVVPTNGFARVFDHPYYALTDADGKFALKDAPAGSYRLVYWHERIGYKDGKDGRFGVPVKIDPGKGGDMTLAPTPFALMR